MPERRGSLRLRRRGGGGVTSWTMGQDWLNLHEGAEAIGAAKPTRRLEEESNGKAAWDVLGTGTTSCLA